MIRVVLTFALGALAASNLSRAETLPTKGDTDSRIRTALYSADEVYRLYGVVGFHLDIEFETGETFLDLSGGDLDAIAYSAHDNVLTLKPKVVSADMNLAVTTSKHRYYFEYSATARIPSRFDAQAMYAVRFQYPAPPHAEPSAISETRIDQDLSLASQARAHNVDYWYCGDVSLKPLEASDDGVHTRLKFGAKAELPGLFVRNDDGSESLLNFNVDAGEIVIHRVASRFIVRRGKLTGCIVNKGFVGSGERLKSGTLAPSVVRDRKDPHP
jgi:type IV secretion system protein VirB9